MSDSVWDRLIESVKSQGWNRGTYVNKFGNRCLLGHIAGVNGVDCVDTRQERETGILADMILENYGDRKGYKDLTFAETYEQAPHFAVAAFNDIIAKDPQDIIDLLEKAKVRESVE